MDADVPVHEAMDREYVGASESDSLVETVELLLRENAEAAVVQRGNECVGVLTERDVLRTVTEGPPPSEVTVGDAMTEPVPTVSPGDSLEAAVAEMSAQSASRLVVTNGTEPLGVLTEGDVLAARAYAPAPNESSPSGKAMAAGTSREPDEPATGGLEDQSICEGCGALSSDLASTNGRLLCAECRDV